MAAYKEKFIQELNKQDTKVAVSGLIIDKDNDLIFIDDKTGVIAANISTDLSINTFVKVFGYVINNGNELQIQGQVIQDLSNANKQLYNKVKMLINQK